MKFDEVEHTKLELNISTSPALLGNPLYIFSDLKKINCLSLCRDERGTIMAIISKRFAVFNNKNYYRMNIEDWVLNIEYFVLSIL